MRILKSHLSYIDVNHLFHQSTDSMSVLQHMVSHYAMSEGNESKLYEGVRCVVAYGFDVDLRTKFSWKGSEDYVTARDTLKLVGGTQYLPIFDEAVKEGLEIWEWNQAVMREVVKWCGCTVRCSGAGNVKWTNSTGMSSIVGIGKRAVEAVVKFAPAQFDEKLEMGTVQLLRAQMMLEMGHGVTFGDMHHGGYVKYAGGTTVTCDYHIDVRMKVLEHVNGAGMLHSISVAKMADVTKAQCSMEHVQVVKVVHVGGDSYVDKMTAGNEMVQYIYVWGGDTYNQKL